METINLFDDVQIPDYLARKMERFRKPIIMPRPFDWERRWPTIYTVNPWTMARTLAADPYAGVFEHMPRLDSLTKPEKWAREYVKEWDIRRNLKPCTAWVKVEASYG